MYPKTFDSYFAHMVEIRERLKDLLQRASAGEYTSYRDISRILRSLYCFNGTDPFLKTMEDTFDFDILVAIHYSTQEEVELGLIPADLAGASFFQRVDNVVTWFRCGHELIKILDAVERDEVTIGGQKYNYKQVIKVTSDNPSPFSVSTLSLGGFSADVLPIVQRTLFELARTSVQLVDLVENRLKNGKYYPYFRSRKKL